MPFWKKTSAAMTLPPAVRMAVIEAIPPLFETLHVSAFARAALAARRACGWSLREDLMEGQPISREIDEKVPGEGDVLTADDDYAARPDVGRVVQREPIDLADDWSVRGRRWRLCAGGGTIQNEGC